MTPLVVLCCGSLVTPLVVSQYRVIGDSWSSVALDLSVGNTASVWLGSESVSVINGDSSNVQLELVVIGESSTASLRVQICSLPWSFIKAASL